ncbi:MAG: DsrE family protein [Thermoplasmata archaeon]|nr:MAG: DsrE family protein [Thermoplasmata archaeon]
MRHLIIINDAPYGTEKAYNGLRLAMSIQREMPDDEVWVFLMADAVGCALPGQDTPDGYYNIERMLKGVLAKGGQVKACGTCAKARGMWDLTLIEGVERSTMKELTEWEGTSDRVVTF